MLNRLKNLIVLQIGDKINLNFVNKKNVLPFLYKLIGFVLVGLGAYFVFYTMEKVIYLKPTNSMILFVVFISQIFTIISNSMELTESLYGSKDNAILLSLPAKHNEIFISKLIVFYIFELSSNLVFLLPILVGFGIYTAQSIGFYLLSIMISLVLPIVSVLIGALLSIALSFIKRILDKYSFIYIILFIAFFALLFVIASKIVSKIPNPLRFMALYNYIIDLILNFIDSANKYALFYVWFSNLIFGIKGVKCILLILALIVVLLGLNIVISRPLFFRLACSNSERSSSKSKNGKNKEEKRVFVSFYKKELLISIRTFGRVVENYSLVVFMPLFLYLLDGLFNSFDLSVFGKNLVFGFNILIGLLVMVSSNSASAKALSEEGSEFVLLKTSPVDTKLIAWAKILNNAIVSFVLLGISMIILGIMKVFVLKDIILIFISIFLVNTGLIFWSFQLDLRNPQIKDVALFGKVSNKKNITTSLTIGVVFSVIFGVLGILLSYVGLISLYLILIVVFFVWRLIVFNANLKSYFYEIEL